MVRHTLHVFRDNINASGGHFLSRYLNPALVGVKHKTSVNERNVNDNIHIAGLCINNENKLAEQVHVSVVFLQIRTNRIQTNLSLDK